MVMPGNYLLLSHFLLPMAIICLRIKGSPNGEPTQKTFNTSQYAITIAYVRKRII
jgi:hypothetical protein